MSNRIHLDLDNNVLPAGCALAIDHVESRMIINVVGMTEITEDDIRQLIQTKYKVAAIHTDKVMVRGKRTGRYGFYVAP